MDGLINFKIVSVVLFVTISLTAVAQSLPFKPDTDSFYKNELGIDVANILTFLKKNTQSYSINYKRHNKSGGAIRSGLNLDLSSIKEKGYFVETRIGYELSKESERWKIFYGSDLSYFYSKSNLQPSKNYRIGIEPLIGVKYAISRHFSVSTELKLNFNYFIYRNSVSFDPSANGEEFQIGIGSVGMVLLNYHFNFI